MIKTPLSLTLHWLIWVMDSCHQRRGRVFKNEAVHLPVSASEHSRLSIETNHMADGFCAFYLGLCDSDKGLLRRAIDHCAHTATPLVLFPQCDTSRLMAAKWVPMSFQWLSDSFFSDCVSTDSLFLMTSAWWKAHKQGAPHPCCYCWGSTTLSPNKMRSAPQWGSSSQNKLGLGNGEKAKIMTQDARSSLGKQTCWRFTVWKMTCRLLMGNNTHLI